MRKEDLIYVSFGAGCYVLDRSVLVSGDYKRIAYINEDGVLSWKVNPCSVSGSALLKIEHYADTIAANYNMH